MAKISEVQLDALDNLLLRTLLDVAIQKIKDPGPTGKALDIDCINCQNSNRISIGGMDNVWIDNIKGAHWKKDSLDYGSTNIDVDTLPSCSRFGEYWKKD